MRKHNDSDLIRAELGDKRRRTSTANVRAYWHAFRDDVMLADEGLTELRKDLRVRMGRCDDSTQRGHIERVHDLSDVRLLDALAWGLGSDTALRGKGRVRQGS